MAILGIGTIYKMFLEPKPEIKESILSDVWIKEFWNADGEIKQINDQVKMSVVQIDPEKWGNAHILIKPRKELRIDFSTDQPLIAYFKGKRLDQIEWFTNDLKKRANNIGFVIMGDVGLDYYNPDETKPRRLYFDIYFDTVPNIHVIHYLSLIHI
mgnify:CR=1 FL=1